MVDEVVAGSGFQVEMGLMGPMGLMGLMGLIGLIGLEQPIGSREGPENAGIEDGALLSLRVQLA